MKEIYVVRHGQTLFNLFDLVQGWADSPLTEKGVQQAKDLGRIFLEKKIHFTGVFTSDRGRTTATANHILASSQMTYHQPQALSEFREFGLGQFEGRPNKEVIQEIFDHFQLSEEERQTYLSGSVSDFRQLISRGVDEMDQSGYGENEEQFCKRLMEGLGKVIAYLDQYAGNRALVVAHGVVVEYLLILLAPEYAHQRIDNGRVTILRYDEESFSVVAVNTLEF